MTKKKNNEHRDPQHCETFYFECVLFFRFAGDCRVASCVSIHTMIMREQMAEKVNWLGEMWSKI